MELTELCRNAKEASAQVAILGTNEKNEALRAVAEALVAHAGEIIAANEKDLENGRNNHMSDGMLDRLLLNESRIAQIADGLQKVAELEDPIGEVISMKQRPNGLRIGQK